jgi:hypothetical protein
MPLGDELTVGSESVPAGYRKKLFNSLTSVGYDVTFVGGNVDEAQGLPDPNNEGHKNWSIGKMHSHVEEFLDKDNPDIVLLMIGSKDMAGTSRLANAIERWDDLIGKIAKLRPFTYIIAANLPPMKKNLHNSNIDSFFNPFVPGIVEAHALAGRRVSFVDVNSVMDIELYESNTLPNRQGFNAIGAKFSSAIQGIVGVNGDKNLSGVIHSSGYLNRNKIRITFSKHISQTVARTENFEADNALTILSATRSKDKRSVILSTSEQEPGNRYTVSILEGVTNKPDTETRKVSTSFTVGFRLISLADWHLGEKYVFRQKEEEIDEDIRMIKYLKRNFGGEMIMIPGE